MLFKSFEEPGMTDNLFCNSQQHDSNKKIEREVQNRGNCSSVEINVTHVGHVDTFYFTLIYGTYPETETISK